VEQLICEYGSAALAQRPHGIRDDIYGRGAPRLERQREQAPAADERCAMPKL
jgi:hypothetical protein